MLKKIMAVAAVSGLALTSAMAQTTSPSTPPMATPPATSADSRLPLRPRRLQLQRRRRPQAPSGKANFVTTQTSDQWLASKFKGTDVVGADDKKIGDVSDVLFDKDKKILAYIVGVGGFLGIGAKDVAVDPASFQAVPGKDATDFQASSLDDQGRVEGRAGVRALCSRRVR